LRLSPASLEECKISKQCHNSTLQAFLK